MSRILNHVQRKERIISKICSLISRAVNNDHVLFRFCLKLEKISVLSIGYHKYKLGCQAPVTVNNL